VDGVPEVYVRWTLRAAGFGDDEVRRLLRAGDLSAVRRGCYVLGGPPEDPLVRHALLVRAAAGHLAGPAVVSHVSAAVLHGLPVWAVPLERVHVTRDRRTGGRSGTRVHVHTAPLGREEVVMADGMAVTSPARTVVDLARTVPFEQAVVVADAALRSRLVDRARLDEALSRSSRWRGSPAARRAVAFADGRSESVGESRSRVAIARAGLPAPLPQWQVVGAGGRFLGRVDFGWPERRTVGEFDGRVKYGRLLRPGQRPEDVVFEEKRREDALRDADLGVVRWLWTDLRDFAPTAARIRGRFRGA
jgi:hypothetical protein